MSSESSEQNPHRSQTTYDAVVVGASIAGSIAALSLADKNWRVAIIEKRQDPLFYKKICTHIIHPSGVKHLAKLGIGTDSGTSTAQATAMKIIHDSRYAFFPFGGKQHAANIERRDIDPALKHKLDAHPNIELFSGCRLERLLFRNGLVYGLECSKGTTPVSLQASLLIAADGRHSETLKMAGGREVVQENGRVAMFTYFAYPEGVQAAPSANSLVWALKDGQEYIGYFPNRQRILVSWYLSEQAFASLPKEKDKAFESVFGFLHTKQCVIGKQEEAVVVAKQTAPVRAACNIPNLIAVGDARLAADPLTGVGCSWAISSAAMLASCMPVFPEERAPNKKPSLSKRIRAGLVLYRILHTLRYRLPSFCMTFMSLHGKWIFNRPVFGLLARVTAGGKLREGSHQNSQSKTRQNAQG